MQSFYAPYLCESCGTSFQAVIDAHLHRNAVKTRTPPTVVCPSCGSDAHFDGVLASFAASAEQLENASTLVGPPDAPPAAPEPAPEPSAVHAPPNLPRHVEKGVTHVVLRGELSSSVRWRSGMDGIEGPMVLDLTAATAVGAGALAPLLTALRSPPPEITTLTVKGAPLALMRALRSSASDNAPDRLVVASVAIEGHCNSCETMRRAVVDVEPGKEANLARAARCPKHGVPLQLNRTLQDVPQRRMPIQTVLFGSGALAGVAVLVVVIAGVIAAFSPGPGEELGEQASEAFTLDERQVTVRGRGGPLPTEEAAREAAKASAAAELMSGLNREISDRRGVSAGVVEFDHAQAQQFLATLSKTEQLSEVDATQREEKGGVVVEATYGLSKGVFDSLAVRFAREYPWGGMTLLLPFPPDEGLMVVQSKLTGVEKGMRLLKVGATPVHSFEDLPVTASGALVTVLDHNGSPSEVRVP